MKCGVCGGEDFGFDPVLWPELIGHWQLSPDEAHYINMQQGFCCKRCHAALRSIALANAIREFLGTSSFLAEEVSRPESVGKLAVLEINAAGSLSPILSRFGHYTFATYPEVDMHSLPYQEHAYDLVVHSDTLEHVKNPVHALSECLRVLKPNGALCFTVPVVVGRMSRNRDGLDKSYHGTAEKETDDYVVHTEFGADVWCQVAQAGFTRISIHTLSYPAATAIMAKR